MNTPPFASPILARRRFMQGAAAASALSLVPWPLRHALAAPAPVLSGSEFQLEIGAVPLTINGRQAAATGVNGQVPAPILRWREGDTISSAPSLKTPGKKVSPRRSPTVSNGARCACRAEHDRERGRGGSRRSGLDHGKA